MERANIKQIEQIRASAASREFDSIFFVACGGSMAALTPAHYFLTKETDIASFVYTSNEFLHRQPKKLSGKSIVVVRSHSGNTPETVEAVKYARSAGAFTIAVSMIEDSPLCKESEFIFTYKYGPEVPVKDSDKAAGLRLFFTIYDIICPDEKYKRGIEAVSQLEKAFKVNKEATKETAFAFGRENKREKLIYTMASGVYYPVAYAFTSCLLMEMLWINSNAIHSGEYFHGPFEITDFDVPFLIIKGIGDSRPLDERAVKFATQFSKKVNVLDVEKFDLSMFAEDLREYFAVTICSAVIRQYADGLAEHTGHPLSVRRYMWKMDY